MKPISLLALSLVATAALSSCGERILRGSGREVTDARDLSQFTTLELNGGEDVEIIPAASSRIEISGFENLVKAYEAQVNGGTLKLGYKDDVGNIRNNNIRVRLYTPGVERIEISGAGDVTVAAPGLRIPVRAVSIAGAGDVTLRQVEVPQLDFEIAGAGDIHAREARAARVNADIAGAGDIEVTATERVKANIAGAGDVHVWGGAQVERNIAGVGDVVRH